ncbi:hypothetical protein [Brucella melitensis]|uniref:hypothetical protein n=1 Tax=Brucella melitensis TaxID=29459 RepID=UPI00046D9234|nr:hypothetical protein [Brucella melitensis]
MSNIETIFSSGLDQLMTFSIGASAGIVGLALAKRGVESGDFDGFSLRYNGMYFEDESELNDYLLDQNDPDREANWQAYLRDIGYYESSGVDSYIREALANDSASAYDDHEQSF